MRLKKISSYNYDTETGFYYLQTRYYDPDICRFISADDPEILGDLASVVGQLNLYAYCLNNPVMGVDPTGEFLQIVAVAVVVVAILAIFSSLYFEGATKAEDEIVQDLADWMKYQRGTSDRKEEFVFDNELYDEYRAQYGVNKSYEELIKEMEQLKSLYNEKDYSSMTDAEIEELASQLVENYNSQLTNFYRYAGRKKAGVLWLY